MQLLVVGLALCLAALLVTASPPSYQDYESALGDLYGLDAEQIIYGPQFKRTECVGRGGNCDHNDRDCCPGTKCRCNLWGANCKCQRKGIFTKLG